jgi:hypothetical protein
VARPSQSILKPRPTGHTYGSGRLSCHGAGRVRAHGCHRLSGAVRPNPSHVVDGRRDANPFGRMAGNVGNSVGRFRDRGHHARPVCPVVGAFGFDLEREVCRGCSVANVAEGWRCACAVPTLLPVLPSAAMRTWPAGVAENDGSLSAHIRNAFDTLDSTPQRSRSVRYNETTFRKDRSCAVKGCLPTVHRGPMELVAVPSRTGCEVAARPASPRSYCPPWTRSSLSGPLLWPLGRLWTE